MSRPDRVKFAIAITIYSCIFSDAGAAENGWYVGGAGALTGARSEFGYTNGTDKAEYDIGWGLSGFAGYRFANGLRAEGELTVRKNKVSNIDTTIATPDGGDTRADIAIANAIYDVRTGTRFTPYIGIGIGIAHISHGTVKLVAGDTVHQDKTALAGQGIAGISFKLTDRWDLFADYRHVLTAKQSYRNSGGAPLDGRYTSQALNFGARFNF